MKVCFGPLGTVLTLKDERLMWELTLHSPDDSGRMSVASGKLSVFDGGVALVISTPCTSTPVDDELEIRDGVVLRGAQDL